MGVCIRCPGQGPLTLIEEIRNAVDFSAPPEAGKPLADGVSDEVLNHL